MRQLKINKQLTPREDGLDKYLIEISRLDLITAEKEVELAVRIQQGDKLALKQLTEANLRFVVSVAKQYQNQGMTLADLINEGNVGLIKAAERFDHTRGFKFISYAVWWIRQSILQGLAENARVVRLPLNKIGDLSKIKKTSAYLEQVYQRPPTVKEIAKELGFKESVVARCLEHSIKPMQMDEPVVKDEAVKMTFQDTFESAEVSDQDLEVQDLKDDLERVINTLAEKERKVLRLFFGLNCKPKSLEEIGDILGTTRERARQIKDRAIKRMRIDNRSKPLMKYLG